MVARRSYKGWCCGWRCSAGRKRRYVVAELELPEAIEQVRQDLTRALAEGAAADIHFPVGQGTLEFHVGVKKTGEGSGKVKVSVLEAGTTGKVEYDRTHKVTVVLQPPVDHDGNPVKVSRRAGQKPG